jgi:hypothetical protein
LLVSVGTGFLDLCVLSASNELSGMRLFRRSGGIPPPLLLPLVLALNTWLIYFSIMRGVPAGAYGLSLDVVKAVAAYFWVWIYVLNGVAERVKFQMVRDIPVADG